MGASTDLAVASLSTSQRERSSRWVLGAMLALMAVGLWAGYSAQVVVVRRLDGPTADLLFLRGHLIKVLVALVAFLLASRIRPTLLFRSAWPLWLVSIGLLVAVLQVGREWNGAQRWFSVFGVSFQPSELARVATLVLVARWMAVAGDHSRRILRGVVVPFALISLTAVLVLIEPDLGSSVLLLFLGVLALWAGGARTTHLVAAFLPALVAASAYGWLRLGHVRRRLTGFFEPETGSQVWQGLTALGNGGVVGEGPGGGYAAWGFVPEADSDFVLTIVGEQTGLIGTLGVLSLYGVFLWHGVRLLMGMGCRFSLVVGMGLVMQVVVQAVLNVAVVTASAPPKGLPLPFVSLGGTSLLVLCASTGLLLGLARRADDDPVVAAPARWIPGWVRARFLAKRPVEISRE